MPTKGKQPQEPLIPVEQDTIAFYGHELVAVRLEDGRIAAVLRWLCEGLHLDPSGQIQRIQRKTALARGLVLVRVETPGGPQAMPALTLKVLPGYLFTVDEARVNPDAQADVIHFQEECADVLAAHFERRPVPPTAPQLVPAEPAQEPARPSPEATLDEWRAWRQAMRAWMDWMDDVDRWRAGVEQRLESHEEVLRLVPEIIERLGPATISVEQQHRVQRGIARLHELTSKPFSTLYAELYATFRVAKYDQLPRGRWAEVEAWFRERMARAGGGNEPEQGSLF